MYFQVVERFEKPAHFRIAQRAGGFLRRGRQSGIEQERIGVFGARHLSGKPCFQSQSKITVAAGVVAHKGEQFLQRGVFQCRLHGQAAYFFRLLLPGFLLPRLRFLIQKLPHLEQGRCHVRTHQAAALRPALTGKGFDFLGRNHGLHFKGRLAVVYQGHPKVFFHLPQVLNGARLDQILCSVPGDRVDVEFKIFKPEFLHEMERIYGCRFFQKLQKYARSSICTIVAVLQ